MGVAAVIGSCHPQGDVTQWSGRSKPHFVSAVCCYFSVGFWLRIGMWDNDHMSDTGRLVVRCEKALREARELREKFRRVTWEFHHLQLIWARQHKIDAPIQLEDGNSD